MNGLIAWFARNSVAANLLMITIVAAGLLALTQVKLEIFPEMSVDVVTVSVVYPGAAPEEVEDAVVIRVEESIQDLEGIKRITSTAVESMGTVAVEVEPGYDTGELLDDIKARVDAIDTFPQDAEQPLVEEVVMRNKVLNVSVTGPEAGLEGERALRSLAEEVRDELVDLDGITQVELAATRAYEIAIELSERALRERDLTFSQVADAVRRGSVDVPGGAVRSPDGEILLRAEGQGYDKSDFERIVLPLQGGGERIVRVEDFATVRDGFEENEQDCRVNGQPGQLILVYRVGDQNPITIAEAVKQYAAEKRNTLPHGYDIVTWQDDSRFLRSRLDLLVRNAGQGLFLVFVVLALFLKLRLAFWVSLGIPISFLGALALLPQMDVSINMLSMFAFILVLGIVVDDAIVVGENIHTTQSNGHRGLDGAVRGTRQVSVPVVFAVLTTVAAFVPMLFWPGVMGKFTRVIPLIVIPTLLFSLVESQLILPAHLAHADKDEPREGLWDRFQKRIGGGLEHFARFFFGRVQRLAVRNRYLTISLFIAALMLTMGFAMAFMKFTFFPVVPADFTLASLTMPEGTPVEKTREAVGRMEHAALAVKADLERELGVDGRVITDVAAFVGSRPVSAGGPDMVGATGGHTGQVALELTPGEDRVVPTEEVTRRWREQIGTIPGAVELTFADSTTGIGKPISVQFAGRDLEQLQGAAEALKQRLAEYDGVYGITDNWREGKREVTLHLTPLGQASGLTLADVARQVRQGFYGEEVQRFQRGTNEVTVMVRYTRDERETLATLENMLVATRDGRRLPLASVAEVEQGRGYAAIRRADRKRTILVEADVDDNVANANDIAVNLDQTVIPALLNDYPRVTYTFEGEQREQAQTMNALKLGYLASLLMIFVLMAVPFKSYAQPLVIMGAIPFGLVGAIWGHWLLGYNVSIMSLLGLVALTGVVVNDSLVLVDWINQSRAQGMPMEQAVNEAGVARFRPILLTSMTTFAGLVPMLMETSLQARVLVPMAISLAFGVVFATAISLVLVPCGYLVLEDLRRLPQQLGQVRATEARNWARPWRRTASTHRADLLTSTRWGPAMVHTSTSKHMCLMSGRDESLPRVGPRGMLRPPVWCRSCLLWGTWIKTRH